MLIQLKDNQPALLEDVQCLIKTQAPCDVHTQKPHNAHGRITNRTTMIYQQNLSDFIMDEGWAACIKTVVQVQRSTDVFDTKTKQYIKRQETAFYLSNHNLENAEICSRYVVQHWGIENKNHYIRDVTLQEDASRIRKNPYNLSVLRSTAMNILRKNKILNIKGELYENALHWTRVFSYPQVA